MVAKAFTGLVIGLIGVIVGATLAVSFVTDMTELQAVPPQYSVTGE